MWSKVPTVPSLAVSVQWCCGMPQQRTLTDTGQVVNPLQPIPEPGCIMEIYEKTILQRRVWLGVYSLAHRLRIRDDPFFHCADFHDWLDYYANRDTDHALGVIEES